VAGGGRILVAGDVPLPLGCEAVDGGRSLVETLMNGVKALRPEEDSLLLATADAPFLTEEAVADFL
jgi:CTP:molybdopterin cytidylyltransferase MocA